MSLTEAKTRLSDLVALVEKGPDDVLITRRGRPAARLVPVTDGSPVEQSLALLLAAREGSRPGPEGLRDLIDDGRRR